MRELKRPPPRLATQKSRTGVFSLPSDARKRVKINRAFFVQIHLLLSQMIQISIGDTFRNHVNQQLKSVNKKAIICKQKAEICKQIAEICNQKDYNM